MSFTKILGLCFSASLLVACAELPVQQRYRQAVWDAAQVESREKTQTLWAIHPDNPNLVWNADKTKLLVVTWKSQAAYQQFMQNNTQTPDNPDYAVWVTAAPQVQQFCQQASTDNKEALNLRLKQYLGLDPNWQYDVFVEMWVSPSSLFRPCVDPETNDKECEVSVPKQFPAVGHIANYGQFYQQLYFKSFRASAGVPWTGLGYTYDWGNPTSKIGASEFILMPKSAYEIKQAVPTQEYCAK